MEEIKNTNSKTARKAGLLYVIVCLLASYGSGYVPSKIMNRLDVVATSNNLLLNETLFRTGIVSHLSSVTVIGVMILLLYELFRPVNKALSRMMLAPALLQIPIFFVLEIIHLTSLMILKSETLSNFDIAQKQELSFLLMRMYGFGIGMCQIFWGLWLFPFGLLVKRSNYIPRIFAFLLLINGVGYVVEGCAFIILQRPEFLIVRQFTRLILFVGLPPTMLWMLIRGIRKN